MRLIEWEVAEDGYDAHSGEIGHLFRSIPATCSRAKRPPIP